MDKLDADKNIHRRFSCDCLDGHECLDIYCDNEFKFSEVSLYYYPHFFWDRVKVAWNILRGKDSFWHGITVREEDIDNMVSTWIEIKEQNEKK